MCVLTQAYNLYNNKPQAATEFSARLDVCRIQYCSQARTQGGRAPSPAKTECPSAGFGTVGLTHSDPMGE